MVVQGYTGQAILFRVPIHQGNPHVLQLMIRRVRHATRANLLANHFTKYVVGTARIVEVGLRGS